MDVTEIERILDEIEKDLPNVAWREEELTDSALAEDSTINSYIGSSLKHRFLVVSFDIESQGFQKGARGYDGTVIRGGMVMRLPRDFAEKIFKAATAVKR